MKAAEVKATAQRETQRTSNETEKRNTTRETQAQQVQQETRTVTVEAARPAWSLTALAGAQLRGAAAPAGATRGVRGRRCASGRHPHVPVGSRPGARMLKHLGPR